MVLYISLIMACHLIFSMIIEGRVFRKSHLVAAIHFLYFLDFFDLYLVLKLCNLIVWLISDSFFLQNHAHSHSHQSWNLTYHSISLSFCSLYIISFSNINHHSILLINLNRPSFPPQPTMLFRSILIGMHWIKDLTFVSIFGD